MPTGTTVPISVNAEAAAHVAQLGMQRELEQMLEHIRQVVRRLQAVEVSLAPPCDPGDDPRLVLVAVMDNHGSAYDATQKDLGLWMVATFPAEVCRHFCLLTANEDSDER